MKKDNRLDNINNRLKVKKSVKNVRSGGARFSELKKMLFDSFNLLYLVIKEARPKLTAEQKADPSMGVKMKREDIFFKAFESMDQTFDAVNKFIDDELKKLDEKIDRLDKETKEEFKAVRREIAEVKKSLTEATDEIKKIIDEEIKKIKDLTIQYPRVIVFEPEKEEEKPNEGNKTRAAPGVGPIERPPQTGTAPIAPGTAPEEPIPPTGFDPNAPGMGPQEPEEEEPNGFDYLFDEAKDGDYVVVKDEKAPEVQMRVAGSWMKVTVTEIPKEDPNKPKP